jgi:CrcB protein
MSRALLVFLASGFGGVLRYWFGSAIQSWWGPTFPLGTFVVNVTGCLGIGFCSALFASPTAIREEYRVAILVGIFGGYTTFSAFGRETFAMVQHDEWARAGLYVLLSNAIGLSAVWAGSATATRFFGPSVT